MAQKTRHWFIFRLEKDLKSDYEKQYGRMAVDEVIESLVDLRGFLHHHTSKRKDIWHPEDHYEFTLDAVFLYALATDIAFVHYKDHVSSEETIEAYKGQFT
jgi:hypothetical protein